MIKHCECLHPSVIPQNNQAVDVSLTVQVQTELRRRPPSASEIPHIKRMHTHEDARQSLLHLQFLNYFSSVKVMASQDYLLPFPYSHIDIILSKVKASFAFPEPFCHEYSEIIFLVCAHWRLRQPLAEPKHFQKCFVLSAQSLVQFCSVIWNRAPEACALKWCKVLLQVSHSSTTTTRSTGNREINTPCICGNICCY